MSDLTKALRARLELPDYLKGDIDDEFADGADNAHNYFKPIHEAMLKVVEAADLRGCSEAVRLDRIDHEVAALREIVGEK